MGPSSSDIEAYSPPYLFRGVRPVIAALSTTTAARGDVLALTVSPPSEVTSVVLMGTGAQQ